LSKPFGQGRAGGCPNFLSKFEEKKQPLASALAQKKRFPGLLAMFARLGEQTGQLPLMLQRAAKQLSAEVQRRAMQLATLLEPLLIVAMGVVVMLIVLAVLLPIIQLNQLVK
jgi:general secretion pathway protein F